MGDFDPEFGRHESAGQARIHIPDHDHPIRSLVQAHRLKSRHDGGGLNRM